jgi:hypothetical protein
MLDVDTDNSSINNAIRIRANTARETTLILEKCGILWQIFHNGSGFGGAAYNLTFSSSTNANVLDVTHAGRIGVANTNPQSMLHLGNCEVFVQPLKFFLARIMDQVLEMLYGL